MSGPSRGPALLLDHANVITLDPGRPRAEAVLCRDGRIVAVGSNEELEAMMDEDDIHFDCGELTLVPGFIDSHSHFLAMGLSVLRVDLSVVRHRDSMLEAMAKRAELLDEGEWVYGVDFDESRWAGVRRLPTREELDRRVSDRHPVVARRICGHIAVANTKALELIGDDLDEVDPETGLLLEEVVLRLSEVVGVTDEEAKGAITLATLKAHEEGVTAIVDMADLRTFRTYREMAEKGALNVRVFCAVQARDVDGLTTRDAEPVAGGGGDMLRLVGIKAFLDGSLGARTAALGEPYVDDPEDPDNRGMVLYTPEELRALVRSAEDTGLPMFLHAIGDRAVGMALDAFEAEAANGNPLRHRIEHLEYAEEEQLDRMKDLRIVASMQPNFIVQWSGPGKMNEERLGPERANRSEALRDVWGRGIPLAFGSDCMPFGPLYGLQGAVHHPVEEQQLPPVIALRAYTLGSAWAVHAEDQMGSIEPGKLADMALLDADPDEAADLREISAVATIIGGQMVHVAIDRFNRAVHRNAQRALEEALMDTDLPRLDLEGPREDDEEDDDL
ncbi:MAG: amidohydrolase family protein [Thermoplasmata archaeon]|nr:amidohydrolase family protein [Thermoplasmata archaeon]